jgi:hypothetical protein
MLYYLSKAIDQVMTGELGLKDSYSRKEYGGSCVDEETI